SEAKKKIAAIAHDAATPIVMRTAGLVRHDTTMLAAARSVIDTAMPKGMKTSAQQSPMPIARTAPKMTRAPRDRNAKKRGGMAVAQKKGSMINTASPYIHRSYTGQKGCTP